MTASTSSSKASFTDDEVSSVIDKLVLSSIRRPTDSLGVRRTDVTFNDIQQSAAGVFLLVAPTPLFFVGMASSRLSEQLAAVVVTLNQLTASLAVLRRRVVAVKDVSALANARAALLELEGSVSKSGPPKDVTKVPAYQRFNANIDRFLGAVGSNIKSNGQLVPTPEEARGKIPGLVAQLQAQMTAIVAASKLVANALKDYGAVNLPQLVSGGIISRARQVLASRVDELTAMNDTQRLETLRETVLEVLGTRAVVKRFGSFSPPVSLADITGVGRGYSDADRPALPAQLDAQQPGPYNLVAGIDVASSSNVLRLYADGAPSYPAAPTAQFFLPASVTAKVEGSMGGPFTVVAGTNDTLRVSVNGVEIVVVLTPGVRTADQVAADLTTQLAAVGYKGESYFFPLMFDGAVTVTPGAGTSTLTLAFGTFPPNSVNVGDQVYFYFGPNAGMLANVTAVGPSLSAPATITVDVALTAGAARVQYGSSNKRVRITAVSKTASLVARDQLQLKMPTALERTTGQTLGMYGELLGRSIPTDADIIADFVNANSARFRAATRFMNDVGVTTLRSDPSNPTKLVAYLFRGTASWPAGQVDVPVVLDTDPGEDLTSRAVCLREGSTPGAVGLVTAQTGQTLTVTFTSALTASSGLLEVGPAAAIHPGMVVVVDQGANAGTYHVDAVGASTFDLTLRELLPVYRDGFAAPALFAGRVGSLGVSFLSRNTTTSSEVEIYDPLQVFVFSAPTVRAFGTTTYFELPQVPRGMEVGDYLEFFTTDLENPSSAIASTRLFGDNVIQLASPVSSVGSWTFGSAVLPMARLRTAKVALFEVFAGQLVEWAAAPIANVKSYFTALNGFIQPLLANANPTDSDVGSAENKVLELGACLTVAGAELTGATALTLEAILAGYTAPYVAEADALYKAFQEKGADRACDFLTSCQFQTFFGLSQDDTSYAGAFQSATRTVAMNDLPVASTNRDTTKSPLTASPDSPDYETDFSDVDTTPNIDPPVGVDA